MYIERVIKILLVMRNQLLLMLAGILLGQSLLLIVVNESISPIGPQVF